MSTLADWRRTLKMDTLAHWRRELKLLQKERKELVKEIARDRDLKQIDRDIKHAEKQIATFLK